MDFQLIAKGIPKKPVLIAALAFAAAAQEPPRFYPDDPVCCALPPRPVGKLPERKTNPLYDFFYHSLAPPSKAPAPARGVNTLGEVPDSEWYTNRHGRKRLSIEQLVRGSGADHPPRPPFVVTGAKIEGITLGFKMEDATGETFHVKPDPISNPEMATGAEVIGTRFLHAIGYNTPENYIVNVDAKDLTIGGKGEVTGENGKKRPMKRRDIQKILWRIPRNKDGTYRLIASRNLPGTPIGAFRYTGTRSDDPNDLIPHEDRRDLRALHVFCAWLNHTDAKSGNSLDVLVEENGVRFVRHYLIDFGAIFGSDSDMPKNARFGFEYIIPDYHEALRNMISFGLNPKPFETARSPRLRGLGRFLAEPFDPELWVSNYPNPAFIRRQPDDTYWAARQVMAFTDEEIRAIVETGQYSDPRTVEYISRALVNRRNIIGRTYFTRLLALESFRFEGNVLKFEDLAVKHGFAPPRNYSYAWSRFDNRSSALDPLHSAVSASLPAEWNDMPQGGFLAVRIVAQNERQAVTVFFRKSGSGAPEVVGIERTW